MLVQSQQIFSVKNQTRILGLVSHTVSVTAAQLCHFSGKTIVDYMVKKKILMVISHKFSCVTKIIRYLFGHHLNM